MLLESGVSLFSDFNFCLEAFICFFISCTVVLLVCTKCQSYLFFLYSFERGRSSVLKHKSSRSLNARIMLNLRSILRVYNE